MIARQRILSGVGAAACALALALSAFALALPGRALASETEQSIIQDDIHLVYATPATAERTLEAMAALGADRVKVVVTWKIVAPDPDSNQPPKFDASDPAAYPAGAWDRYDLIVRVAKALGMGVYFALMPPAPNWGVSQRTTNQGHQWSHYPKDRAFGQFVTAVARRYSGSYVPASGDPPSWFANLPIPVPGLTASSVSTDPLPRVDYWGIWNEPNEAGWLNPQFSGSGSSTRLIAPALYRGIANAAYRALAATGHASDTILIGETASYGWIKPIDFVEALYCVSRSIRPLSGDAAAAAHCPRSGNAANFVKANPGLFEISGYAHHPYSFDQPPTSPPPLSNEVTLYNLPWLERTLDRIFRMYGKEPAGGVPMYLSEWGYKSNPPNPYVHTSLAQQATWLNEGEYMSYRDQRVRSLAQYLLYDEEPRTQYPRGSELYWGTFQSGLEFASGRHKPVYNAFRIPLWMPSQRHGSRVTIWGELRPANHSGMQYAVVQFRRRGTRSWGTLIELQTANREGFFLNHISISSAGRLRVAWLAPGGQVYYSRTVAIS